MPTASPSPTPIPAPAPTPEPDPFVPSGSYECRVKIDLYQTRVFYTAYEAHRYCVEYAKQKFPCRTSEEKNGDVLAITEVREEYTGHGNSAKEARREAYKILVTSIERQRLYALPLTFNIQWKCEDL